MIHPSALWAAHKLLTICKHNFICRCIYMYTCITAVLINECIFMVGTSFPFVNYAYIDVT